MFDIRCGHIADQLFSLFEDRVHADYNLRNIEPEGRVRNFMVAHSGESLVLLGVISAGVTVGMTFIMGRRIDAKDGKRK